MRNRLQLVVLLGALAMAPAIISAQNLRGWRESSFVPTAKGEWTGQRLSDGQPDVSGHWSNTVGNHNNLTDPQGPLGADDEAPPQNGGQNARRVKPRNERAPSRISDPPDGQIPFQPWARAKQQEFLKYLNNPILPEYVEPFARCAPGGPSKSFMWHGYEIRQFPGSVVFLFDSGNRVIYLDGRPHLPSNLKLWNGDSRGHWEGNTLVVDTTNFSGKFSVRGSDENLHLTERFTRASPDTLLYEFTVDDSTAFTKPWSAQILVTKTKGPIFEYACHEGNYAMVDILAGARAADKKNPK